MSVKNKCESSESFHPTTNYNIVGSISNKMGSLILLQLGGLLLWDPNCIEPLGLPGLPGLLMQLGFWTKNKSSQICEALLNQIYNKGMTDDDTVYQGVDYSNHNVRRRD